MTADVYLTLQNACKIQLCMLISEYAVDQALKTLRLKSEWLDRRLEQLVGRSSLLDGGTMTKGIEGSLCVWFCLHLW